MSNGHTLMRHMSYAVKVKTLLLLCLIQLSACTARDSELENTLTAKLQEFKNSKALSMDLNDVLDKNWRQVCVQGAFTAKEEFIHDSGEKVNLLDISENEIAIWVFYDDGSVRAAVIKRTLLDFGVSTSKSGALNVCTSTKYPYIYTTHVYNGSSSSDIFFFNDR